VGRSAEADRPDGLLDGETIVALTRVRFSPGMPTNLETIGRTTPRPPSVVQRHAYARWAKHCDSVAFPIAGPEMILGVTQERLLVWRPGFLRSRPRRFAGAVELSRIRRAGVQRRVFKSVLTLLLEDGAIVGVETTWSSRLREFAAAIPSSTEHNAR
jgi:hypothetical protein